MKNHSKLLLLPFAFAVADASAQDGAAPADTEAKKLETVTVTGSRISNPNVVSPTPVSVLTAADIAAVGATNIGDVMTQMPQLSTMFTMGNSTRFIGTAGVQETDLRNLGTSRTLVLVNGRRFVGASAGDTSMDVNLIPADWVDRVEIITGGASAVYGADAVTGVINFILKQKYEGANLHAQIGTSQHGGFNKGFISGTFGTNFAQDRGNAAVSFEHSRQDKLEFSDRFGHESYRTLNTPGSATDTTLLANAGGYTNYAGGTFSLGSSTDVSRRYVFDPNGEVRKQRFGGYYDNAGGCVDCDRTDTNQVLMLQPKFERTTLSGVANYDWTADHRLYAEATFSSVQVERLGQPAFGSGSAAYRIMPDNAYVTPALAALMNGKPIRVSRFDVDAGRRGEETSRDTGRLVIGANGVVANDWRYDAYLDYGNMRENRANTNNRINERFAASIDAVRDPKTGQIVCRSTLDPNSINAQTGQTISDFGRIGCIPTSIFGVGAINPAAAGWFNTTTYTRSRITQEVAGGSITNDSLFPAPFGAGSASFSAGVEYRKETSSQDTDPLDNEGLTFLNAIPSFRGSYDVKEAFAEFGMPVLADRPFFKNLSFDAAIRGSDYNTIGRTKAWRWGLDWAFDDNVRVRGTMSSAVRAPNIGELFSGQAQNFFAIDDPCSAQRIKNGENPALRQANCNALGVPTGWLSTRSATVEGVSGSNPDLKPETGRTYTFGFVFTPQFIEGLGFNVDYWNIKLTDAISTVTGQDTANRCVDSASGIGNAYCPNARRDAATHELVFINQTNLNLSALNTSGIDFNASYTHELFGGRMKWEANVTRVISFTEFPFQEDPSHATQDNGTLGFPEWKAMLSANYDWKDWRFNWNARYFSSMLRVSNESYASNPTQTTPITAGARTYSDWRLGYRPGNSGWEIYGGINNVFDRDPPVNLFGTGFGSGLYDATGRAYYVGVNYKFK